MSADFDPYRILSVGRAVSPEQLKTAARQRARLAHPDFGGSADKLTEVNLAYEVLADPQKRNAYDQYKLNPNDPEVAARWSDAWNSAMQVTRGQGGVDFGAEVTQLASQMQQSRGVRMLAGALVGGVIGGGAGLAGGHFTTIGMPMGAAVGGAVGLLAGALAGMTNSA